MRPCLQAAPPPSAAFANALPSLPVFYGVPFASPPVGDLRFKPPVPASVWTETKATKVPKGGCPQMEVFASGILGPLALSHNEDCLYLDIFVPPSVDLSDPASTATVPVMFWIFGGGFFIGSGLEFGVYDGKKLAADNDVVVVSHNYRPVAVPRNT